MRFHCVNCDSQFTVLQLSSDIDEEQVGEVFVRINSKGESLNKADFILTLMSVFWEDGRKELEEFCRLSRKPDKDIPGPLNYFINSDPSMKMGFLLGFDPEAGEGVGGAVVTGEGQVPSAEGPTVYLNGGDDLAVALARVEPSGGKIALPKTNIGNHGFIAQFMDTEGNRVALHSMN